MAASCPTRVSPRWRPEPHSTCGVHPTGAVGGRQVHSLLIRRCPASRRNGADRGVGAGVDPTGMPWLERVVNNWHCFPCRREIPGAAFACPARPVLRSYGFIIQTTAAASSLTTDPGAGHFGAVSQNTFAFA